MPDVTFQFHSAADGMLLTAYVWRGSAPPRALLVIAHGAAEHALRYERFARALNRRGIEVFALDHRGHGKSLGPDGLGQYGKGGWEALVADLGQLIGLARAAHPGLPLVLFGHSMGSFAAQQLAPDASRAIDALILSGSTAVREPAPGEAPPRFEPNKAFGPARTPYDWLSRDGAEVDKYVADPLCGFDKVRPSRPLSLADLLALNDEARLRRIRPDLPCLLIAGEEDPLNARLEGLKRLEANWRAAGVRRVDSLTYPGARHELLNETNREQVTADTLAWIEGVISG